MTPLQLPQSRLALASSVCRKPLLTIAIPTYNRSSLLRLALHSITLQSRFFADEIEIIVSDNASTDDTEYTINDFRARFPSIKAFRNTCNEGPDYNIKECFCVATGKYVWIFSDDDLLLPNALERLLPILRTHNYCLLTLEPSFYRDNPDIDFPDSQSLLSYKVFADPMLHLTSRHFWLTYITGTIVNKSCIDLARLAYPGNDSHLVQMGWVLPALFHRTDSAHIQTHLILARSLEIMDFKLFYVFGRSYTRVLALLHRAGIIPWQARRELTRLIITDYFPHYLQPGYRFAHGEKGFPLLLGSFWFYHEFWTILFPLFIKRWCSFKRLYARLRRWLSRS